MSSRQLYEYVQRINTIKNPRALNADGVYVLDSSYFLLPRPDDDQALYLRSVSYSKYSEDKLERIRYCTECDLATSECNFDNSFWKEKRNSSGQRLHLKSYQWDGEDFSFPMDKLNHASANIYDDQSRIVKSLSYPDEAAYQEDKPESMGAYTYDDRGLLTSTMGFRRDELDSLELMGMTTYHHNDRGQLTHILTIHVLTNLVIDSLVFYYDQAGRMIREEDFRLPEPGFADGVHEYSYDDQGLLSRVSTFRKMNPDFITHETLHYTVAGSLERVERHVEDYTQFDRWLLQSESLYTHNDCLLYTSPSPRDQRGSRMPSSA